MAQISCAVECAFPAPAGLNRQIITSASVGTRVPRTRGAEPDMQAAAQTIDERSPHPRG